MPSFRQLLILGSAQLRVPHPLLLAKGGAPSVVLDNGNEGWATRPALWNRPNQAVLGVAPLNLPCPSVLHIEQMGRG